MPNIEHGKKVVIIYICLLLAVVITNMIKKVDILSIIYLIALIGSVFRYLIISKE